ncbi:reverse transcriptase domain-containing protein [Tanacetum coccineum]|uniref:Reverse transcriptase domain-containing protein n=1 Tax=Tanacetum coccineum TaxID=301880 RepID=A0ABQ4YBP0_9ASTR
MTPKCCPPVTNITMRGNGGECRGGWQYWRSIWCSVVMVGLMVKGMSWDNFKVLMREEFCPSNEMQKLESELWNHNMVGAGHAAYTDRFHELPRLVPHLVNPRKED